ncbi:hypothetical protein KsCSTR_08290 [Candidatus Kuenenia stuttgartiensis]|uniref:Uncharacterized protein n=1 Tax=Kuenenia stuttgartiensis TaxID=174633 RepID=Q1PZB3_KUEST|nr:hypothetical protein KsCSTR_08290 [Candidatus Kuenenia stuttgartiensis]CAJ72415.1 unknown protein [Candidatus Kuenenia stuttgartiensis]
MKIPLLQDKSASPHFFPVHFELRVASGTLLTGNFSISGGFYNNFYVPQSTICNLLTVPYSPLLREQGGCLPHIQEVS